MGAFPVRCGYDAAEPRQAALPDAGRAAAEKGGSADWPADTKQDGSGGGGNGCNGGTNPGGLLFVVPHSPHDGGDLAAGQGVVGLVGAGAVGEVALDDACGVQGLDVNIVGIGEGLLVGEVGGGQLQSLGRDLGDLQTGDGAVQLGIAGDQAVGLGLGQIAAEGTARRSPPPA